MMVEPALRAELLASLPNLRAFAFSLVHNRDYADDLVQGTMLNAWASFDHFERGTSLNAWLFTILRNRVRSEYRLKKREVQDPDGTYAAQMFSLPEQQGHLDYEDTLAALARLPLHLREALLLVRAEGLSYDQAAAVCQVPVGTLKSRVHRARARLAKLLDLTSDEEIGPDRVVRAAVQPRCSGVTARL